LSIVQVTYCTHTGRIRRIDIPTQVGEVIVPVLGQTEAAQPFPIASAKGDINSLQETLNQSTGLSPPSDRYVMVDGSGNVVGAVHCCPICDGSPPGITLVQHDQAGPAWKYIAGSFIAPPDVVGIKGVTA
jgi:hypothetical protein